MTKQQKTQQKIEKLAAQLATLARENAGDSLTTPDAGRDAVLAAFPSLLTARKEHFVALFLDSRRCVIGSELVSVGTLNSTLVHPREVFAPALVAGAASILVAHNHPSGDVNPSQADRDLTRRLKDAGDLLGVALDDHIIVGKQGFFSMRQHGQGGLY